MVSLSLFPAFISPNDAPPRLLASAVSLSLSLSLGLNSHRNNTAGQPIPVDSQHPITNLPGWFKQVIHYFIL